MVNSPLLAAFLFIIQGGDLDDIIIKVLQACAYISIIAAKRNDIMRKILTATVSIMCVLTLISTGYANFDILDTIIFACMIIAVITSIVAHVKGR